MPMLLPAQVCPLVCPWMLCACMIIFQVWDAHSLDCVKTLEGHDDNVRVLAVGEQFMFSGSWDKTIRVSLLCEEFGV